MLWLVLVGLLLSSPQLRCQDIEINDEESFVSQEKSSSDSPSVDDDNSYKGSSDMSAILSFVNPPLGQVEFGGPFSLVAGKPASFIVSLENSQNSSNSYSLDVLEAALHYPRYFGYHIQNFTVQRLQNVLEPKQQASLYYSFVPAAQLTGQHFDLAVILTYHDQSGRPYFHALFNETITFLEDTEGMDVELVFLGVMIVGICVLALVFVWHCISEKARRRAHGGKSIATFNGSDGAKANGSRTKTTEHGNTRTRHRNVKK